MAAHTFTLTVVATVAVPGDVEDASEATNPTKTVVWSGADQASRLNLEASADGSEDGPWAVVARMWGYAGSVEFTSELDFFRVVRQTGSGGDVVLSGTDEPIADDLKAYADAGDANTLQFAIAGAATLGANTGSTAPDFTGTAPTSASADAFTGTGMTASGQTMTSTDHQTMTLNQCAGMWLVTATHSPMLIVSNTAVSGAPAVLTVMGAATTDAGAYKILRAPTPAGTVSGHQHAQS